MPMIEPRYAYVYDTVFRFMVAHRVGGMPQNLERIAHILKIPILTVTQVSKKSGLSREEIIDLCGNEDGAVFACQYAENAPLRHSIIINDDIAVNERTRFTIAEECAHVLLGHTQDSRFNCGAEAYDETVYQVYEQEARAAAGLLIVSPRVLQLCKNRGVLNAPTISTLCQVSLSCARVRIAHFEAHFEEMSRSCYYGRLPLSHWQIKYRLPKVLPRHTPPKHQYPPDIFPDEL